MYLFVDSSFVLTHSMNAYIDTLKTLSTSNDLTIVSDKKRELAAAVFITKTMRAIIDEIEKPFNKRFEKKVDNLFDDIFEKMDKYFQSNKKFVKVVKEFEKTTNKCIREKNKNFKKEEKEKEKECKQTTTKVKVSVSSNTQTKKDKLNKKIEICLAKLKDLGYFTCSESDCSCQEISASSDSEDLGSSTYSESDSDFSSSESETETK